MANLPETPTYTAGVYQLETTDSVLGGSGGISNTQAQQLGNRTAYLKQHMDTAEANIATNTADIASNTSAIATKAPLASPALTGVPTAPTATAGTNTTQIATTAFVTAAFTAANLAQYAPLASPALTGTPTAPTATAGTNNTQIATTAFATAADTALSNSLTTTINLKAPLASPALTGTPTAPTATAGTNNTQIATTAFATAADAALSSTLTTSIGTKWTKAGDQATGDHGINVAPVSQTGLSVQSTNPDAGFALRVFGDMRIKPAASQTVDQALLYFQNKAGTWGSSMGLQTGTETIRFWNNSGVNVAVIDSNGNYVGANIEMGNTFTPVIVGTSTAGTGTYSVQDGTYAVIGNTVVFSLRIVWTAHTGTGNMRITGLPLPALTTYAACAIYCTGTFATANAIQYGIIGPGTTAIDLYERSIASTSTVGKPMFPSGNSDIVISGSYRYR